MMVISWVQLAGLQRPVGGRTPAVKVYFGGDEHISPTLNRADYPLQSGWASLVVTEDLESKD